MYDLGHFPTLFWAILIIFAWLDPIWRLRDVQLPSEFCICCCSSSTAGYLISSEISQHRHSPPIGIVEGLVSNNTIFNTLWISSDSFYFVNMPFMDKYLNPTSVQPRWTHSLHTLFTSSHFLPMSLGLRHRLSPSLQRNTERQTTTTAIHSYTGCPG